jgi:hydroxyacylglutathione hydrolase
LPATIESFNGVYSTHGQFVMMNQMRVLAIFAGIALLVLVAVVMGLIFYVRRRRRRRLSQA